MIHIYSVELGLEQIADVADLPGNATVVVAVLKDGVTEVPTSLDQVFSVYCPHCEWLHPYEPHQRACPHDGAILR